MKFKAVLSIAFLFTLVSCNSIVFTNSNVTSNTSSNQSSESDIDSSTSSSFETSNETTTSESSFSSSKESSLESSSSSDTSFNGEKETKKLTILSINDLHGRIEQENGLQGMSNLQAEIKRIKNLTPEDDVILIANGDMFQGQAISNLNHGLSVINAMNEMQFDMMGIGNHEFDWGIEEITRFFDGNVLNGEANFPLVNSNVYRISDNTLLEHSVSSHVIEKNGLKVGFVSAIGQDQYTSILTTRSADYEFKNMITYLGDCAKVLREQEHCDVVIANIHDGGTTSYYTSNNNAIAKLSGSKHIDALINGHTHYGYGGIITRDEGAALPVVQAYSSGSALGVIELEIENKKVVNATASQTDMRYKKAYDQDIQNIVDKDYELLKDQIEEVYGVAGETISRTEDLREWAGSCMQKATGADIAFSNNGGLRGVSLVKGREIMLKDAYEINPFDNEIIITYVSGSRINNFISRYSSSNYYAIKDGVTISNSNGILYKVAVIDYLGFKNYFPLDAYENTHLIYRDIMIQDIKKRTELGMTFSPSSNPSSYLDPII